MRQILWWMLGIQQWRSVIPTFMNLIIYLWKAGGLETRQDLRDYQFSSVQFSSVAQWCPTLWTPWVSARQASLSITNTQSSLRLMSIESVMPSSHFILCCPLLLLPPIPPSIRVFSNESTVRCLALGKYSKTLSICIITAIIKKPLNLSFTILKKGGGNDPLCVVI